VTPVTLSEDARRMLQERMAASGIARPLLRIGMAGSEPPKAGAEEGPDWTIRRRELWTVFVADEPEIADGDARIVMVDGLPFVCEYFPIRFDISVANGRLRVGATA